MQLRHKADWHKDSPEMWLGIAYSAGYSNSKSEPCISDRCYDRTRCTGFPLSDILTHIVQNSIVLTILFGRFSETVIKAKGLGTKVGFSVFSGQSSIMFMTYKIRNVFISTRMFVCIRMIESSYVMKICRMNSGTRWFGIGLVNRQKIWHLETNQNLPYFQSKSLKYGGFKEELQYAICSQSSDRNILN